MFLFRRYVSIIRGLFFLFLIIEVSSFAQPSLDIEGSRETALTRTIEKISPSIASINVIQIKEYIRNPFFNDPFFQFLFPDQPYRQQIKSLGSGVVIGPDGYIITNQHVIEKADKIIVTLPGGKEYNPVSVWEDRITDIAVLKIDDKNLPYAKLGSSDDLIIGEWVIALGNPFGLFDINKQPTATVGIISAMNLDFGRESYGRIYQGMIQTDASINQGNSGGPLCNANGDVIGINTFIYTSGGYTEGSIGIGFAIPINRARDIAEELKKYGRIDRSYGTGIEGDPRSIDRWMARYLKLPRVGGVLINGITKGSTAEKAGLEIGDVILEVNNVSVNSVDEIKQLIQENYLRAGDKLTIVYYREGKKRKTELELSKRRI